MTRHHHEDDEDERRGLLQDGQTLRVPMTMRDSASWIPQMRDHFASERETQRRAAPQLRNRPGYIADGGDDARERAYRDAEAADATAWMKPGPIYGRDAASGELIGGREGDSCIINGGSGTMRMINGVLTCVADDGDAARARYLASATRFDSTTLDAAMRDREAAYAAYDEETQNAWRGGPK